jgi:hypothetical protein
VQTIDLALMIVLLLTSGVICQWIDGNGEEEGNGE